MPHIRLRGVEIDALGATGVGLAVVIGYALLLYSPVIDLIAEQSLHEQQREAARTISLLQKQYTQHNAALQQSRIVLASRGGWIAGNNSADDVLSRVNEFARQCDIALVRWQPQGERVLTDYQLQSFQVEGTATWPALMQWFALIEQGVPLLDVTHFSVNAPASPTGKACEFTCSMKLYRGPADKTLMELATVHP